VRACATRGGDVGVVEHAAPPRPPVDVVPANARLRKERPVRLDLLARDRRNAEARRHERRASLDRRVGQHEREPAALHDVCPAADRPHVRADLHAPGESELAQHGARVALLGVVVGEAEAFESGPLGGQAAEGEMRRDRELARRAAEARRRAQENDVVARVGRRRDGGEALDVDGHRQVEDVGVRRERGIRARRIAEHDADPVGRAERRRVHRPVAQIELAPEAVERPGEDDRRHVRAPADLEQARRRHRRPAPFPEEQLRAREPAPVDRALRPEHDRIVVEEAREAVELGQDVGGVWPRASS
jgi:hypothetical protein